MELSRAISAILFYQAEPVSVKRLSAILKRTDRDIHDALMALDAALDATGLLLLRKGDEVTLGTKPEAGTLIEAITKEELAKDLTKASLETLAVILYKGPVTRSEIDYVRGVNSTFILRNLLVRGLIERIDNPADQRSFLYQPTFQLLEYMGISSTKDLPEYSETIATLAQFTAAKEEAEASAENNVVGKEESISESEETDIAEENAAGANFDDKKLRAHTDHDRINI